MTNLNGVVAVLKKEQNRLTSELRAIGAALAAFGSAYGKSAGRRGTMSAAGRERIAAAQRARWAKVKGTNGAKAANKANVVAIAKKRTISAAGRKKIAAAQRARWAKVKAAKSSA